MGNGKLGGRALFGIVSAKCYAGRNIPVPSTMTSYFGEISSMAGGSSVLRGEQRTEQREEDYREYRGSSIEYRVSRRSGGLLDSRPSTEAFCSSIGESKGVWVVVSSSVHAQLDEGLVAGSDARARPRSRYL